MIRILAFLLFPTLCFAGGDYSKVRITKMEGSFSQVEFVAEFIDSHRFDKGCDEITVRLDYGYVPWYSWLFFIDTTHPSLAETEKAVAYLKSAFDQNRAVYFGYMGSGLKWSTGPCFYNSKGLRLSESKDFKYVLSFYDPV